MNSTCSCGVRVLLSFYFGLGVFQACSFQRCCCHWKDSQIPTWLLFHRIHRKNVLLWLNVCHNDLGDAGAESMSAALKMATCHLKWLSLTSNSITDVGAQSIASSLTVNENLVELRFSRNSLGPRGLKALATSLQENTTLAIISLRLNGLLAWFSQWNNAVRGNA